MVAANSGLDTALLGYVTALATLASIVIALLYSLYSVGMPGYTKGMVQAPVRTAQGDALSTVLLAAILLGVLSLVSLVVLFGATYGMADVDSSDDDRTQ